MQIAAFDGFDVYLDFGADPDARAKYLHPPSAEAFAAARGLVFRNAWGKVEMSWTDVNGLQNMLRWVTSQRPAPGVHPDGVVAALLLQQHNAAAPGDFG